MMVIRITRRWLPMLKRELRGWDEMPTDDGG
jgi:hypothetical protein